MNCSLCGQAVDSASAVECSYTYGRSAGVKHVSWVMAWERRAFYKVEPSAIRGWVCRACIERDRRKGIALVGAILGSPIFLLSILGIAFTGGFAGLLNGLNVGLKCSGMLLVGLAVLAVAERQVREDIERLASKEEIGDRLLIRRLSPELSRQGYDAFFTRRQAARLRGS